MRGDDFSGFSSSIAVEMGAAALFFIAEGVFFAGSFLVTVVNTYSGTWTTCVISTTSSLT